MKTQGKRVVGFVVGSDRKGSERIWKVKVKDPNSVHDDTKLVVASVRPGNELRSSADVTFRVEPVRVNGEFVLQAVGVNVGKDLVDLDARPSLEASEGSGTLNVCATELVETGEVTVFCSGLESLDQAKQAIETDGSERVVGFSAINMEPADQGDEVETALTILWGLACVDATQKGLEYLFTEIFQLGQDASQLRTWRNNDEDLGIR